MGRTDGVRECPRRAPRAALPDGAIPATGPAPGAVPDAGCRALHGHG
ncbi:hypothetical protein [Streptomyces xinghaiensis]|nr:hypothetical protein [Streptomyces xinghaiensis]